MSDRAAGPDTPAATEPAAPEPVELADVEDESFEKLAEPRWSTRDRTRERELIALIAELPEEDPRRTSARDELVDDAPAPGGLPRPAVPRPWREPR